MWSTLLLVGSMSMSMSVEKIGMSIIPTSEFRPLYMTQDAPMVNVESFSIDQVPVTNRNFYEFVIKRPRWKKENIASIFSDEQYLAHWQQNEQSSWEPLQDALDAPVVNVSWFAASAFCDSQGNTLPSISQWEIAALAGESSEDGRNEPGFSKKILEWYANHGDVQRTVVGNSTPNYWGVYDMHGLIWEWTADFNSILVSGESRADSSVDQKLFCAAGTVGSADPKDYAAFMRYGFRSSLQATYSLSNLGFRCAMENKI